MHQAEPARRTRSEDLRAFADAFSEADDAFGPEPRHVATGRTLTLAELGDALVLNTEAVLGGLSAERPDPRDESSGAEANGSDVPDFDFGTRAVERARRRTEARLASPAPARRRVSGPSSRFERRDEAAKPDVTPEESATAPPAHVDNAADAASVYNATRVGDPFASDPDARRVVQITGRPGHAELPPRSRERAAERRRRSPGERMASSPDRLALWAVLLGIFLVVIASASSRADAAEPVRSAPASNVVSAAPAPAPAPTSPAGLRSPG